MLLILASGSDFSAAALSAGLFELGVNNRVVSDMRTIRASVRVHSNATSDVRLAFRDTGEPVNAILNRSYFTNEESDPFIACETMAAWWSALALFPGPVVNRPNRRALLPWSWTADLARNVKSVCTLIRDSPPDWRSGQTAHAYAACDGTFLGRVGDGEGLVEQPPGPIVIREFRPENLRHLFVAGEEIFDLEGGTRLTDQSEIRNISEALAVHEVTFPLFAHIVVSDSASGDGLLRLNLQPPTAYYAPLKADVHHALMRCVA